MSKYTAGQFRSAAGNIRGLSKLSPSEIESAAQMLEYAAHLAAQAEWPAGVDMLCEARAAYVERAIYENHPERSREPILSCLQAAIKTVRPPVGVVSDEDVKTALKAACGEGDYPTDSEIEADLLLGMRAALESYASCHARQVPCDAILKHDWEELSCVRSKYEPSMETGWRRCRTCCLRSTFSRSVASRHAPTKD